MGDAVALDPRIIVAEMVIGLGIKTYEEVKSYLSQNSDDDTELAGIMTE